MPGTRCAVGVCNNSFMATKSRDPNVSYHKFPRDRKRRSIWIAACRRKDSFNPDTSAICGVHFTEEDFEVDLRARLMNIKTKRMLKPNAVPSLLLKLNDTLPETSCRTIRAIKRCNKEIVHQLLMEADIKVKVESSDLLQPLCESVLMTEEESAEHKYQILVKKEALLRNKYNQLRENFTKQKFKINYLEKEVSQLSKQLEKQCKSTNELESVLNKLFSPEQKDIIMKKKRRVIWKSSDISKAFIIRYLSKECYHYLRNSLKYPLPHTETLRKWALQRR